MSVNLLHNICFLLWLIRNCIETPYFSQIQITLLLLVTVCTSVLTIPHPITAHMEHKTLFFIEKVPLYHMMNISAQWKWFVHNCEKVKITTSKTLPGYMEQLLHPNCLWQTYKPQSIDHAWSNTWYLREQTTFHEAHHDYDGLCIMGCFSPPPKSISTCKCSG